MAGSHMRAAAVRMRSLFGYSCLAGGGSLARTCRTYACADWSCSFMTYAFLQFRDD